MAHGVRLASLLLMFALVAACTGQAAPSTTAPQPSAPATPVVARATANPCLGGLTHMEAFSQRMADDLALLRPLVMARTFDPGEAVAVIRRVSATLTAFKSLDESLLPCDLTADFAERVEVLLDALAEAAEGSLSAPVNAAQVQRDISVTLFGLLPEVLALSGAAKDVADSLGMQMAVAMVPDGADKAVGSLPPLPTPTPRPTTRPTPRPTTRPTTGGGSSGSDWTKTANAYSNSVYKTYGVTVAKSVDALRYIDCTAMTSEECSAVAQEGYVWVKLAKTAINKHLAFMKTHPAATCFRDAYAADKKIANSLLRVLSDWFAGGPGEMRYQNQVILGVYAKADTFRGKLDSYFRDCR